MKRIKRNHDLNLEKEDAPVAEVEIEGEEEKEIVVVIVIENVEEIAVIEGNVEGQIVVKEIEDVEESDLVHTRRIEELKKKVEI